MSDKAGKVKVGRATVSWGPRPYGPDMMLANCPVCNIGDLIEALDVVRGRISAAEETQ